MKRAKRKAKRKTVKRELKPASDKFVVMYFDIGRQKWCFSWELNPNSTEWRSKYRVIVFNNYAAAVEHAKVKAFATNQQFLVMGARAVVGPRVVPIVIKEYR